MRTHNCFQSVFLISIFLLVSGQTHAQPESQSPASVAVPTSWLEIKTPSSSIVGAHSLANGTGDAKWGSSVVLKRKDVEFVQAKHASYKGLKLLRDLSFGDVTLKKGCVVVLTNFPQSVSKKHGVGLIECDHSEVIIRKNRLSGSFSDFESGERTRLAPTLGPLTVKSDIILKDRSTLKAGTIVEARDWNSMIANTSLSILKSPDEK